jgi:hypothetical protein
MLAWAFSCTTPDEVASLVRALGKHRYVHEVDHQVHWMVDRALAPLVPSCAAHDAKLRARAESDRDLDLSSYDPTLWRKADADDIASILKAFWAGDHAASEAATRLRALLDEVGLPQPEHDAFEGDAEYPHHPQLVQLAWTCLPVGDLDAERHAGAITAMEEAGEEVDVGAFIEQEGPDMGVEELCAGAEDGELVHEWLIWADGPYAYNDYVFRGASKLAKLQEPPEGLRDLDDDEADEDEEEEDE